jgi:hypothetical protein
MWKRAINYLESMRPCKQAIAAIEINVEVTRELNESLTRLNESLSDYRIPQRRSTDRDNNHQQRA